MKTICDKCNNYTVNADGCSDWCSENKINPFYITREYFEIRRDGNAKTCKAFVALPKEVCKTK